MGRRGDGSGHCPRRIVPGARQADNGRPAPARDNVTGRRLCGGVYAAASCGGDKVCGDHGSAKALDCGDHGACREIQVVVAGHPGGVPHGGKPGQSGHSLGDRSERIAAVGENVGSGRSQEPRDSWENSQPRAREFAGDLAEVAGVYDREGLDGRASPPAGGVGYIPPCHQASLAQRFRNGGAKEWAALTTSRLPWLRNRPWV